MPRKKRTPLPDALKAAIAASGQSVNSIAQATGLEQAALSRFVNHHQDIVLASAEKLAAHLNLELTHGEKKAAAKGAVRKKRSDA